MNSNHAENRIKQLRKFASSMFGATLETSDETLFLENLNSDVECQAKIKELESQMYFSDSNHAEDRIKTLFLENLNSDVEYQAIIKELESQMHFSDKSPFEN